MSRVESDSDTQAAQEAAQHAEKQQKKATEEQSQNFKRMLVQKEQQHTRSKQQQQSQNQNAAAQRQTGVKSEAHRALLAKQGIAAGQLQHKLQEQNTKRGEDNRLGFEKEDKLHTEKRESAKRQDEDRIDEDRDVRQDNEYQQAVSREEERRQENFTGNQGGDTSGMGSGSQSQQHSSSGQQHQSQPQAIAGAQAADGPKGSASLSPQQQAAIDMARKIANKMAVGQTADGKAMADIQLNQDLFPDSKMRITYDNRGRVEIFFSTSDKNIARLVGHSETHKELANQLKSKNITLADLVVERN